MVVFSLVLMVAAAFFASATTTASSSHPELRSALSTKGQRVLPTLPQLDHEIDA